MSRGRLSQTSRDVRFKFSKLPYNTPGPEPRAEMLPRQEKKSFFPQKNTNECFLRVASLARLLAPPEGTQKRAPDPLPAATTAKCRRASHFQPSQATVQRRTPELAQAAYGHGTCSPTLTKVIPAKTAHVGCQQGNRGRLLYHNPETLRHTTADRRLI